MFMKNLSSSSSPPSADRKGTKEYREMPTQTEELSSSSNSSEAKYSAGTLGLLEREMAIKLAQKILAEGRAGQLERAEMENRKLKSDMFYLEKRNKHDEEYIVSSNNAQSAWRKLVKSLLPYIAEECPDHLKKHAERLVNECSIPQGSDFANTEYGEEDKERAEKAIGFHRNLKYIYTDNEKLVAKVTKMQV